MGKTSEAEENLSAAAATISYKAHPEIWVAAIAGLAKAYTSERNFEKAAENFVRVLSIAPDRADIRSNFALMLYEAGKFDDAQRQIEASLNQNPNVAESHNIYGLIVLKLGKRELAIQQFEKALKLKPDFAEADRNLKNAKTGEGIN